MKATVPLELDIPFSYQKLFRGKGKREDMGKSMNIRELIDGLEALERFIANKTKPKEEKKDDKKDPTPGMVFFSMLEGLAVVNLFALPFAVFQLWAFNHLGELLSKLLTH